MKKGEQIEVEIAYNNFPNIGVGLYEGKKVRVKNALVGQTVSARIKKKRSDKVEARLLEVLKRGPREQASFCEHFNDCGGCLLQTLSFEAQTLHKKEMVQRLLDDAGLEIEIERVIPSPEPFEYRNKMEFSFGDLVKDGPMTLGMHRKGRHHDVVTVDHCHICDGDYRRILTAVLEFANTHQLPKYNKFRHEGLLKHLVVRKGKRTGDIMVALSASTQVPFDKTAFVEVLRALPLEGTVQSILWVKNDGLGDVVSGDIECLYGSEEIREEILGLTFHISLYAFFQPNTLGAEILYDTAIRQIEGIEGKVCLDLFSGTGTIGQLMAQRAEKVIGIEIVEDAVKVARKNADFNGLKNCEFLCGDVFEVLNTIEVKPDVIVVDPPRVGMREKTARKVAQYGVEEFVYVSCNPKTLVEDLMVLKEEGYEVERFILIDQFPWTGAVESVVKLRQVRTAR